VSLVTMCDASRLEPICDGDLQAANLSEAEVLPRTHAELLKVGVDSRDDFPRRAQSAGEPRLFSSPRQARCPNAGTPRFGGWNNNSLTAGTVMLRLSLR